MRLHFAVSDVAKIKIIATIGPAGEGALALGHFGRPGPGWIGGWQRRVRFRLGSRAVAVEHLVRGLPRPADRLPLVGLVDRGAPPLPEPSWTSGPAREQARATLYAFCNAAVLPYWDGVRAHLEAERDLRGRIMATSGVEWLLASLNPRIRWDAPVLEVAGGSQTDVQLDGRGLLLCPSLFLPQQECLLVDKPQGEEPPVLMFAAASDQMVLIDGAETGDVPALGALIGHTRAAALQVLADGCTTGELAGRLGLSLAGASKHATVLRGAGLVTTTRRRNTAMHTLTSLGLDLLLSRQLKRPALSLTP